MLKMNLDRFKIQFLGFIILVIGVLLIKLPYLLKSSGDIKILFFLVSYIFIYLGIYALFNKSIRKSKKINWIFEKILSFPLVLLLYIVNMFSPLFVILLFVFLYFVPSLLLLIIIEQYPSAARFSTGIIYLLNTSIVVVYTYAGNKIMNILIALFEVHFSKEKLSKYSTVLYMRKIAYFVMIMIYLIHNFLLFSNISIGLLNVTKEVLITFIAIDTFLQLTPNQNSASEKESIVLKKSN